MLDVEPARNLVQRMAVRCSCAPAGSHDAALWSIDKNVIGCRLELIR